MPSKINLSGANKQAANVESTLLKGKKQKRLREKAAQNNQISEKTSLLVKETFKKICMFQKNVVLLQSILQCNIDMISTADFEQLFFEYQPRLVRFAVRYLEEEAAEDIVQNAFLKLWEKRESMALTNAQALLFQMVHNECLNELKHRVVAGTESLDALMEVEGSEQLYWQDFAPDADAVLIGEELQQQIDEALTHVSEKSREIFTMSRQKEMKPKEIAEELGITRQAVEKHINAALDALRTHLPKNLLPLVAFWQVILLYE